MKIFAVLMLLAIVGSLFSGLFFLYQDRGAGERTVRALTLRIGLSLTLFILLLSASARGSFQAIELATANRPARTAAATPRRRSASTRRRLEGEMPLGREVALERATEDHRQHDGAERDVETWKPVSMKKVAP